MLLRTQRRRRQSQNMSKKWKCINLENVLDVALIHQKEESHEEFNHTLNSLIILSKRDLFDSYMPKIPPCSEGVIIRLQ